MRLLALISVFALLLAVVTGGSAPVGRLLLAIGVPGAALPFLADDRWRGIALYRAGDYAAAAVVFDRAGDAYNAGNAYTHNGKYAAALEAYDLAITQGHPNARANFDVVAAYYAGLGIDAETLALFPERKLGPETESAVGEGNGRAAGTGSDVTNTNTMMGLVELESSGRLGVRRVFDDRFIVADERWLRQLSDVPGDYMASRIAAEYKRRVKAGIAPPAPEDPR